MITDIPTPSEFEAAAISMLNLAWDVVTALLTHVENAEMAQWDEDGQVTDEFWKAAQQPLGNAQALVQQGIEFLLKARIAEVSPFLLIDRTVREWPKDSARVDTKYAEFRTVDAQDLIRIYNTVRPSRLDPAFAQRIEGQRRTRNAFIHSIDKSHRHRPDSLWITILDVAHHLIGPTRWIGVRRKYLESTPTSVAFSVDHVSSELAWESLKLLATLQPAQQALYLGVTPKARRYICYHCSIECRHAGLQPTTAQLRPNSPKSTEVYCFVCDQKQDVERTACKSPGCKGNVIVSEDHVCLTCYKDQPTEPGHA